MVRARSVAIPLLFLAGLALGLASCTPAPRVGGPFAEIRYDRLLPIRLDVSGIEVESTYKSPGVKPNVEHLFPVSPVKAAMRWGRDRLRPAGAAGVAKVVVRRASVVEEPLARTTGLRGLFTKDQSERYNGVIEITVEIFDNRGRVRGRVAARSQRTRSVAEDVSLNEREAVWYEMTKAMMDDVNTALETQIRRNLRKYIR